MTETFDGLHMKVIRPVGYINWPFCIGKRSCETQVEKRSTVVVQK
jgi:hypothetical protein